MRAAQLLLFFCVIQSVLGIEPDDPSICEKWIRQSKEARCGTIKDLYQKFCPTGYIEECEDFDESVEDPSVIESGSSSTETPEDLADVVEEIENANKEAEFQQCCRENGVKESCMSLCTYGKTDLSKVFCDREAECESYLKVATYCGTNVQDNSDCCEKLTKKPICNVFCNGEDEFPELVELFGSVKSLRYASCLNQIEKMNQCSFENRSNERKWESKEWAAEAFPEAISQYVEDECLNRQVDDESSGKDEEEDSFDISLEDIEDEESGPAEEAGPSDQL